MRRRAVVLRGFVYFVARRYPYPVYGTAGPVGGGPRGDYRRSADPDHTDVISDQQGKGVNEASISINLTTELER